MAWQAKSSRMLKDILPWEVRKSYLTGYTRRSQLNFPKYYLVGSIMFVLDSDGEA